MDYKCSNCQEFYYGEPFMVRDLNNYEFPCCPGCAAKHERDMREWAYIDEDAKNRGFVDAHEADVYDQLIYVSSFVVNYEQNRRQNDYEFWLYCNRPVGEPIKYKVMPIA